MTCDYVILAVNRPPCVSVVCRFYESTMEEEDNHFDALERTIHEIEALSIIFNDESDNKTSSFTVLSKNEYNQAQILVIDVPSAPSASNDGVTTLNIPTLCVEIVQHITVTDSLPRNEEIRQQIKIQFTLFPGYPSKVSAFVSDVSIGNLASRTQRDTLAKRLNEKAAEITGCEALIELIQEGKDAGVDFMMSSIAETSDREEALDQKDCDNDANNTSVLSRRWLWVHHITNMNRRKDIVTEANERSLSGYLKSGYPGIVIVEGDSASCDEFVRWIKGNKSQPGGGFGRNWGHHVRGEITLQDCKSFTNIFQDTGEDLSVLSSLCREAGLEDEFKLYVMQH